MARIRECESARGRKHGITEATDIPLTVPLSATKKGTRAFEDVQGIRFQKDGLTFKASQISRQFSFKKLRAQLIWDKPQAQTEIEPKQRPIRQEVEQNFSVTDSLIESNGLGLFTPSDAPPEDEQPPSWQKQKKKERKKNRGIRF